MTGNNFISYVNGDLALSKYYPRAWDLTINKLKNIDYVKNLGIKIPQTFWVGKYNEIPWDKLPLNYVIKPVSGSSSRGVFIIKDGLDISTNSQPDKLSILNLYEKNSKFKGKLLGESDDNRDLVYITELIGNKFADDYKFYVFNGNVELIRYNNYKSKKEKISSYFDKNWNYLEGVVPQNVRQEKPKPKKLDLMIEYAQKIALDLNVPFIRVDFYLDDEEPVFGELCMTPNGGKHYFGEILEKFNSLIEINDVTNYHLDNQTYEIAVVIPTFNNIEFLEETINSIILSGLEFKIEILVGIDGCEKTKDFVKTLKFPQYVKFLYFSDNGGPYTIKNTLAKITKADKIIFFDSDDLMSEKLIPEINKILDNYEITKFKYLNFTDKKYILSKTRQKLEFAEGVFGVKKELFLKMNGFEPWMCAADSDYWGRVYKSKVRVYYCNELLMFRRLHSQQLTRRQDTGMKSGLRAQYWKISKSKRGDGNPKNLTVRNFIELQTNVVNNFLSEEFLYLRKKSIVTETISKILTSNIQKKKKEKRHLESFKEINYDVINKLKEKKLTTTESKFKTLLPQDRQILLNSKKKF